MNKIFISALGAIASTALLSGAAQAQALRPNILVVFDTSGSMLSGGNDGSPLCGSAGTASRIYSLKKALRDAMAQVGTDEANFGLMRYPQTETAMSAPVCPRGHYNTGSGGGCRLSTDANGNNTTTAEMAYGPWFDTAAAQALVVPVTKPSTGLKPAAASDFDPSDANITEVYKWIDLSETAGSVATITDPELRSPSNASTPIGRSLFYARMYFDNYVKAKNASNVAIDPKAGCRQNLVIFVTDGSEQCDTTRGAGAVDPVTCVGTGFATYQPEVQACKLNVMSKVPVYILTDKSIVAADQQAANRMATLGGTGPTAIYVTLTDTNAVKQALIDIIAKTVPPAEVCNGIDDNCNGQIDEGVKNACALDPNPAHYETPPKSPPNLLTHCAVEQCNCADDNCNGLMDEGLPLNACGGACGCAVPVERCDGLDNDCDGDIDEGFNVGAACDNGLKGACHRTGILACNSAGTGTVCDAPVVGATQELCNNIDDDCDGFTDNGMLPGVGVSCGNSLGTCMAGITQCVSGRIICSSSADGGMTATTEICNGLDDNCDGVIDNGNFTQTGQTCLCPGLDASKVGVGTCKAGRLVCRGTRGFVCEGCVLPGVEVCDGMDNDCDGVADLNPVCPSGLGCKEGRCTLQCIPGEFPCPSGYKCVSDYCIPQRCAGKTCPTDQRCDENTGDCVDVCAGVVCKDPKICQHGSCVDCYTLGCATGQMCNAGRCQVDKCLNVSCAANQYCDDGKCVDLCTKNKCSGNDRCVAGQCMSDSCATVGCADSQYCDQTTGSCKTDTCKVTQCGKGERCIQSTGVCTADPCNLVDCPGPCWTCAVTSDGMPTCRVSGDCHEVSAQIGSKGGGDGCGCAVGGDVDPVSGISLMAAMIGLAGVISGRRKRR
jgi:MYXO-CTERM domain-containing protein